MGGVDGRDEGEENTLGGKDDNTPWGGCEEGRGDDVDTAAAAAAIADEDTSIGALANVVAVVVVVALGAEGTYTGVARFTEWWWLLSSFTTPVVTPE